jgi:hypothetical protein
VKVTDSEQMRDQLMKSIRLAFSSGGAIDVEATEVDSLLAEISGNSVADVPDPDYVMNDDDQSADTFPISGGEASANQILETPPDPDPQFLPTEQSALLHSIPHNESQPKSDRLTPVNPSFPLESDTCVSTGVNPNKDTPPSEVTEEGEGVTKIQNGEIDSSTANPPVNVSEEKG